MPAPRTLTFASVAEAPAEAARLHEGGYRQSGNWDLTQISAHLADWLTFAVDGFPTPPLGLRPVLWALRHTVGPRALRKILAKDAMSAGVPTDPMTVHEPAPGPAAEAAAVERLRAAAERFAAHEGEYAVSPFFGRLTREQCRRLHAIHCAHHLGFLEPT
ncbi:DUF1569 domain-containing protein [Alienimonas sp. DA493]|uniref:DUF1569 domain-containing protein n=1 Tax=Alienimonas sp. DA493 TaxID=3373605 RepID=UPI0037545A29